MSRDLSLTFREAINAQQTDEVFLVLLTIDHDDLGSPFYVVNNNEDIESNGNTFVAYPFDISLPDDSDDSIAVGKVTIDNVHRDIVVAIRGINTAPDLTIQVVLASDPDTIEAEFSGFKFTDIVYDELVISGNISIEDFMHEPFPGDSFVPRYFPGLF